MKISWQGRVEGAVRRLGLLGVYIMPLPCFLLLFPCMNLYNYAASPPPSQLSILRSAVQLIIFNTEAKFLVPDGGHILWHRVVILAGLAGRQPMCCLRAGTTTLCHSRLYPPISDTECCLSMYICVRFFCMGKVHKDDS
jgi:hypothetical protein